MNIPNIIIAYDFIAGECCILYCPDLFIYSTLQLYACTSIIILSLFSLELDVHHKISFIKLYTIDYYYYKIVLLIIIVTVIVLTIHFNIDFLLFTHLPSGH